MGIISPAHGLALARVSLRQTAKWRTRRACVGRGACQLRWCAQSASLPDSGACAQWILQFLQHREEKSPAKTPMDPEEAAAAAAVAAAIGATGSKAVSPAVVSGIQLELAALTGSQPCHPAASRGGLVQSSAVQCRDAVRPADCEGP